MKIADRIKKLPNEVIGNLILIGFLICGLLASVICAYLNRTKVFYLALSNKAIIYILAFQSLAITAIFVSLIISELSVLRNHLFKYILLYLVFIWVGINCTVVYFHSTLLLLIPLIISRCYNSRKMTIRAI